MTQNTIDLAIAALNLNSPSDTTSPGNTGICGGKPPFGKSLQEAMQTTDMNSVSGECDTEQLLPPAEQLLPPAGQELPLESAYNVGLEGITEVRALVDAISSITRGADQLMPLKRTLSFGPQEPRITISDAVLIAETTTNKDTTNRSSSPDSPSLGVSSITQSESKFVNRGNAIQVSQQPLTTKPSEVVSSNELATHLRVLKSSGGGEARLQLHPAELGRMTVNLITEGDEARISFVVDNPQAKQAVEVSLPRLRDLMDEAGLSLTDADVSDRHAKENENQRADPVTEETTANSRNGAEDFEESNSPSTSQLVDTFA